MVLIVGATGMVGGEVARLLAESGETVRALTRATSNPDKVARLRGLGAQIAQGDLKDPASLDAACRGVTAIISTASSTISRQQDDSIESVDRQGQLNLIDAAERAGVKQFILISFPKIDIDFPLQSAKRAAEERLQRGRMTYTVLQPTCLTEIWLSPMLGFDPAQAMVRIFGDGQNKISWVSFLDVARFAVAAVNNPRAANSILQLGGPEPLSPLQVVGIAEQLVGKKISVQHVPMVALQAQHDAATDPLQQSMTALMLYFARGHVIEMSETLKTLPLSRLRSVHDHLQTLA